MFVLNFTHPIDDEQRAQIESLVGRRIERLADVPTQFDQSRPFAPQVAELVESVGLASREWQTEPIMIVPPALSFIAATLLAELHGRMGYFAPIVRTAPVEESLPTRYEVMEVINLQAVRDKARGRR
ncbi:MAG: hypothetical protein ISS56_19925 [Anaerolineae bacterium]|nr:hypothetical protein [Anaerolineae bacterium]